jgi:hypothetical protein
MKNIIRISSLAFVLAASLGLPAIAATEEDAAAPAGSFTSDMHAPHMQFAGHQDERFARHHFHHFGMRMPHAAVE